MPVHLPVASLGVGTSSWRAALREPQLHFERPAFAQHERLRVRRCAQIRSSSAKRRDALRRVTHGEDGDRSSKLAPGLRLRLSHRAQHGRRRLEAALNAGRLAARLDLAKRRDESNCRYTTTRRPPVTPSRPVQLRRNIVPATACDNHPAIGPGRTPHRAPFPRAADSASRPGAGGRGSSECRSRSCD